MGIADAQQSIARADFPETLRFWREPQANTTEVDLASDCRPSAGLSPEMQVLTRELTAAVRKIVAGLSMRERSVLSLVMGREIKWGEIGHRIGLKVGAVKVYMAPH